MSYALDSSKFLAPPELYQLHQTLDRHASTDLRNVLMLRLLLATGARSCELLGLKWVDFDTHTQSVLIRGRKNSNNRQIPLDADLFNLFLQHRDKNNADTPFPISYKRLQTIWHQYRPCKKGIHCLRHTFAINLYQKTKDLRLVKVALGHRNVANTMIYAEYDYQITELRRLLF